MKTITHATRVVFWLAICQLPMLISKPFVDPNLTWYHSLVKPPFVPPDMLFGLVWAVLYLLLGIAAVMVFHRGVSQPLRPAAWLLAVQLGLNALWTPVFFGMHHLPGALTVVVLMLLEGLFLHRQFAKHSDWAARLLWLYWAWVAFATYLTAGFMLLN